MSDLRQRFFIEDAPIRGEIVSLQQSLHTILNQRDYAPAIKLLLGEMLSATALLASTLKIQGRISLQIQATGLFKWAMAECDHQGHVRGLAEYQSDPSFDMMDASTVLQQLQQPILFINIEPEFGDRYQGIVPLDQPTLAGCLKQYFDLSVQIPTEIILASSLEQAGGLLIQLLPRQTEEEKQRIDHDLWPRLTILANTLKSEELLQLAPVEILYRLYHEEQVRLPEAETLMFACTCSRQRCEQALQQIGVEAVKETLLEQDPIIMDCQFCQTQYQFNASQALALFGEFIN